MSMEKKIIDCKAWSIAISLRRYGVADIEIEVPLSSDEDPRGSLVIDTARYNGVAQIDEVKEAVNIYELLWINGEPTQEAAELANRIKSTISEWLRKHFTCRQGEN